MGEMKKSTHIVKGILIYLAGFITAIILGAIIGLSGRDTSSDKLIQGLTIFQEQGNPIDETQFKVFQVLDSNLALANGKGDSGLSIFTGITVLLIGGEGKYFYDDEVIVLSSKPNQAGSYQYESQRGRRTVPVIIIMSNTSKREPSLFSDNLSDVSDEVLSWYTGIGTITTKTRYSIDQTVTVNMIIGYNSDDTVTSSELESLQNELRDFTRRYFSEKMGLELTVSNENRLEREIIEILNSRYLNKAKIERIKFLKMEVKGDY